MTKVTFLANKGSPHQRARPFVYVEFGDDETMKVGLEKNEEKMGEGTVSVQIATDREERADRGVRGGFRRGRGGGYAARGFAAAGLTRGSRPHTNGEARESAAA